jgi:eukaryotic-like serine/threonine-protein kinase
MDVTLGQLLDKKYRIVRLLGEGGMGAVYEGENVRIRHRVAIKVLHAGIAMNGEAVGRFEREAQAAGQIGSEHIVEVYDLGELPGGARYMVMEYLDGENLSNRIARLGRIAPEDLGPIMVQLLEGLAAAHDAKIVHRDLKPENIFLQRSRSGKDFVKIVDFGISKFNVLGSDSPMSMTRTGTIMGTPFYMSPEQAKGVRNSDHRSDLYSAGVVLFECATGEVPFRGETFNELMFKIALEAPPDPEALVPGLDPHFATIIRTGMAREPAQRYQSASDFAQAILQWMRSVGRSTEANAFLGTGGPASWTATDASRVPRPGFQSDGVGATTPAPRGPLASGAAIGTTTPAPRDPLASGPAIGTATPGPRDLHASGAAAPSVGVGTGPSFGAATPSFTTPSPTTTPTPATTSSSTTNAGSLNVVAATPTPAAKRSQGGVLALLGAAALVVVVGGLFLAIKLLKAKPSVEMQTTATTAAAAAQAPATPAPPPTAEPPGAAAATNTANALPLLTAAPVASNTAATANSPAAGPGPVTTATGRHSSSHRAGDSGPAAAESAGTTTQVKGRTVRTDL